MFRLFENYKKIKSNHNKESKIHTSLTPDLYIKIY